MLAELDHGIRCEEHIGEAFRVRCFDCDEAASAERAVSLLPPHSLVECHLHAGYFHYPAAQCDRCTREANP